MEAARIVRVPDHLVDGVQEWDRRTDDDDVRGGAQLLDVTEPGDVCIDGWLPDQR